MPSSYFSNDLVSLFGIISRRKLFTDEFTEHALFRNVIPSTSLVQLKVSFDGRLRQGNSFFNERRCFPEDAAEESRMYQSAILRRAIQALTDRRRAVNRRHFAECVTGNTD